MPDPERLLTTLHRARDAFRATPGRTGRLVSLTAAVDVIVGGDLHGHLGNFQALLKKADLAKHPRRHLVLQEVVHGQHVYSQGGDKSHQLLDLMAALKCQYPDRVHFLPGNHELAQATDRAIAKGDVDLNKAFIQGIRTAYGCRADEVYAAYLDLIVAAPLVVRTANRVFVSHSLPSAVRMADFQLANIATDMKLDELKTDVSAYALVWGRDTRPAHVAEFLEKVDADLLVTGHIPCDTGFFAPNDRQVILDSMGSPGGYCLFPTDRPLTHAELMSCVGAF